MQGKLTSRMGRWKQNWEHDADAFPGFPSATRVRSGWPNAVGRDERNDGELKRAGSGGV